jgi:hypothetical protein
MKSGVSSLELEVHWNFSADGNDVTLASVTLGGRALPEQLAKRLIEALTHAEQSKLTDEAWDCAEDEDDDDAGSDAAREVA